MGSSLAKLSDKLSGPPKKVLFAGMYDAGKTTLLYMLGRSNPVTKIPTIGEFVMYRFGPYSLHLYIAILIFEGFVVEEASIEGVQLISWDLGGRSPMRPLFRHYYPLSEGVVFVIDGSSVEMLNMAKDELRRLLVEEHLAGKPLLLAANKTDLKSAMELDVIVSKLGLNEMINETNPRRCKIIGCSMNDLGGLKEGLAWLREEMYAADSDGDCPRAHQMSSIQMSSIASYVNPTAKAKRNITLSSVLTLSDNDFKSAGDNKAVKEPKEVEGGSLEQQIDEAGDKANKFQRIKHRSFPNDPTLVSEIENDGLFSAVPNFRSH